MKISLNQNQLPMYQINNILAASLLMPLLASCAGSEFNIPELPVSLDTLLQPNKRAEYTGTDSVGVVDPDMLVGTWQVEFINGSILEKEIDTQYTFNGDGSLEIIAEADIPVSQNTYEGTATWSVEGEYIALAELSGEETTDDAPADSTEVKESTVVNVYEISAEHIVLYDEKEGLALSLTRL